LRKSGPGGFGTAGTPAIGINGTVWNTDDIWIRRTFNPGRLTPQQIGRLVLRDYHDEDIDVYINGVHAYSAPGYNGRYEYKPISREAKAAIKPNAENTIAVRCHQTTGGQYIDVGIFEKDQPAK